MEYVIMVIETYRCVDVLWRYNMRQQVKGNASVSNADQNETLIAAPGSGQSLVITKVTGAITVASTGGAHKIALEDGTGGTQFGVQSSVLAGNFALDFSEQDGGGYQLTENTLLNLTCEGSNAATAFVTALGYKKRV
jgi:hypothetical protein